MLFPPQQTRKGTEKKIYIYVYTLIFQKPSLSLRSETQKSLHPLSNPHRRPNLGQFAIQISRYDINYTSFLLPSNILSPIPPVNHPPHLTDPLELISQFRAHETFEGSSRNRLPTIDSSSIYILRVPRGDD